VAGEGDGFFGNTFLEAAVTEEGDNMVIEEGVLSGVVTSSSALA